eukprot:13872566-Ditylum_brightwellii.AAC.1
MLPLLPPAAGRRARRRGFRAPVERELAQELSQARPAEELFLGRARRLREAGAVVYKRECVDGRGRHIL